MWEARQDFIEDKLTVDLHTCSTGYAIELFEIKIREAYKYGLSSVEFIYGTPDNYEGSIEEAFNKRLREGHELVREFRIIHAGVVILLRENPFPEPRDEDMCFSAIDPEYDNSFWKKHEYLYPYYPYRTTHSTAEIADYLGISRELVRAIASNGYDGEDIPDAELRTVYNADWKKNLTRWYFTNRSLEKIKEVWRRISEPYVEVLTKLGASDNEIATVLAKIKSIPKSTSIQRSAKSLLTRVRKEAQKN